MWATCLRQLVNHTGDHTTSICEGWHQALKRVLRGQWGEHLRVDRLIDHLLTFVTEEFTFRRVCEADGQSPSCLVLLWCNRASDIVDLRFLVAQGFDAGCIAIVCKSMYPPFSPYQSD
jgi:hypothetical protein